MTRWLPGRYYPVCQTAFEMIFQIGSRTIFQAVFQPVPRSFFRTGFQIPTTVNLQSKTLWGHPREPSGYSGVVDGIQELDRELEAGLGNVGRALVRPVGV